MNPLLAPGVAPFLDGKTPVFIEVGADPTAGAGFDLPIGSIARFGTAYYLKLSSTATDWSTTFGGGGSGPDPTPDDVIAPLAAAATNLNFSGLAGNTDKGYRARFRVRNTSGGTRDYSLRINGATTGITIFRLFGDGTNTASDNNGTSIKSLQDTAQMEIFVRMFAKVQANFLRMGSIIVGGNASGGTAPNIVMQCFFVWNNAADEVTQLGILGDGANAVGIGSDASLYIEQ